ncbi:MAG: hypothetical protein WAM14_03530 [Candidatus Nitrosopolaris sp.]
MVLNPNCPAQGQSIPVTLQPIIGHPKPNTKPYQISYGQLPLQFTSQPKLPNALCTLQSNAGSLPVIISWPNIQGAISQGKQIATVDQVRQTFTNAIFPFSVVIRIIVL